LATVGNVANFFGNTERNLRMSIAIRQVVIREQPRWCVDFGYDDQGKRTRKFYHTEDEAINVRRDWERDQKRDGDFWASLTKKERAEHAGVVKEIMAAGLTPRGVWEKYKELQKSAPRVLQSVTLERAIEELETRKLAVGKSERYVKETCSLLRRFAKGREKQMIDIITADTLEQWIHAQGWGLKTKKSNMGRFSSLWTVAVAKGWCSENIVDRLEQVGKLEEHAEIFDNETCLNLLAATQANSRTKKATAVIAIGMFCGMRPDEISHPGFGWEHIDLRPDWRNFEVTAEVAKDKDQRTPKLQSVAVEWLELARELKCPLPLPNERKIVDECCEIAGITHWPKDVLRKTCATHLSNHYKNDWMVAADLGNSIRTLLHHYKKLGVPISVSESFWKLDVASARARLPHLRAALLKGTPLGSQGGQDGGPVEAPHTGV
jgi:integrase